MVATETYRFNAPQHIVSSIQQLGFAIAIFEFLFANQLS
jgi:hypothetical protein